jgi:hypothetical protein
MTLPNSLLSFTAQQEFMYMAMDSPTGKRMFFRKEKDAERFKIKCNYARVLHRRENMRIHDPDSIMYGKSEYDVLVFTTRVSPDGYWVYARREVLNTEMVEDIPDDDDAPPLDITEIMNEANSTSNS